MRTRERKPLAGELLERALDVAAAIEDARHVVGLWARYVRTAPDSVAQLARLERAAARLRSAAAPFRSHYADFADPSHALRSAVDILDAVREEVLAEHPDFDAWPTRRRSQVLRVAGRRARRKAAGAGVFDITQEAWAEALGKWRGRHPAQPRRKAGSDHEPATVLHRLLTTGVTVRTNRPEWASVSRAEVEGVVRGVVQGSGR